MWESGSLTTEARAVKIQSVCNRLYSVGTSVNRSGAWQQVPRQLRALNVSPGTLRNCTTVILPHTLNIVAA